MPKQMAACFQPEHIQNRTGYAHIAFSVGTKEAVNSLTEQLRYEENPIEITV
jgi:lactoylglutathione lyase